MKKEKSLVKGTHKKYPNNKSPQPQKPVINNRIAVMLGMGVIILLGSIVYSNSFKCSFHFDDFQNIVDNTKFQTA